MSDYKSEYPIRYTDQKSILDNGITVITRAVDPIYYHPVNSFASAILTAGCRHAPSGHVHFLEHLVLSSNDETAFREFGQVRHYGNDFCTNASTSIHHSTFCQDSWTGTKVDIEDLLTILPLHLRVLKDPDITSKNVEFERGRILSEISGNDPQRIRFMAFANKRVPIMLPYGALGSSDEVSAVSRKDLESLYNSIYTGSNIIVPVVYPAVRRSGVNHEIICDIVSATLGDLPAGSKAQNFGKLHQCQTDLRLDASLLSNPNEAHIEIAFQGVQKYSQDWATQVAVTEIFGNQIYRQVTDSGKTYGFSRPWENNGYLVPGLVINFSAFREQAALIIDLISSSLIEFATTDLSGQTDLYKRSKAREHRRGYRTTEECAESLILGLINNGTPGYPDALYAAAARITPDQLTQHIRGIVHGPVAIRADVGTDGDPKGKYVPFAAEFAQDLQEAVSPPRSNSINTSQAFGPSLGSLEARRLQVNRPA